MVLPGTEQDTQCMADLELETPVETVKKGVTEPANVEPPRNTEIQRRHSNQGRVGQHRRRSTERSRRVPGPQTKWMSSLWTFRCWK